MAIVVKDRVQQTSTTTGTSDFVLSGSVSGYQDFSAIGNNTTYYCAVDPNTGEWEVGIGTYTVSTTTLTRTTVLESSNSGNKVNFAAGTRSVFCTYPAEKAIYEEPSGNTLIDGGPLTVIGANVSPGYTTFSAALAEMYANVTSFAQVYARNLSTDQEASADMIVYRDNTVVDTANFMDMGINSEQFSSTTWPIFTPASMYLYGNGGEMFIGSETDDVVFFAGGVQIADEVGRFSHTTGELTTRESINVGGDVNAVGGTFTAPVTTTSSMTAPSNDEFVTKAYVDNATANGFHVHTAVQVATTGNLTATYNNGTLGVGATLTNSGAQAALVVDGVSVIVNDRVLVWQQSTPAQNGVYVVTTVGSGATNWVLTRSSDTDTSGESDPNSLGGGDYFFVESGATLGSSSYVCTNDGTIVFGTTAITFSLFSSVPSYVVVSPLNLTGNTLSLTGVVATTNGGTGTGTVTTGDLLYGSGTNAWSKLAFGTTYNVIRAGAGGTPEWGAVNLASSDAVSGSLAATNGGTGQSTYATGDILYSSASNTLSKLSGNTTTTKKFLTQTGTGSASAAPTWDVVSSGDISGLGTMASQNANNVAITGGTIQGVAISGASTIDNTVIGGTTPVSVTGTAVIASNGLVVNSATVSANYSIPSGSNAMSAGPVTVNSGVAVTIPSGSVWTVV